MLCNIALSLLHKPPDSLSRRADGWPGHRDQEKYLHFFFHINREHGVSIILTSHGLKDVEKLCLRIIVIDKGHVLFDDSLEKLKNIIAIARRGPWLWN